MNIISFINASIAYGNNIFLNDLNFSVGKKEFVYLTGKVGSGKSSIFKTIYAELPLKQGEVTVSGFNLKTITKKEIPFLRRKIGIVFQDFQLLTDRNVLENLRFILEATGWRSKELINNRIQEVLNEVELNKKESAMPFELSGGEQQSIAIARAILNKPDLILADEPTGNLDAEATDRVMNLLKRINQGGSTVFIATHDIDLIRKYQGRVLNIENNSIK